MDAQGNLERTWKVWEFENKCLWQAVFRKFIYSVPEGKGCSLRWSKPISLLKVGLLLKERICSHGEQILSCKSNPNFEVIQLAPLK